MLNKIAFVIYALIAAPLIAGAAAKLPPLSDLGISHPIFTVTHPKLDKKIGGLLNRAKEFFMTNASRGNW